MMDIDIDMKDRNDIVSIIKHIPASRKESEILVRHGVGVYLQDIPIDIIKGITSIPFYEAETRGYFKIDFLNLSIYKEVVNEQHLNDLINEEPIWDMLYDDTIRQDLFHLRSSLAKEAIELIQPRSLSLMAIVLAIIRPGKKYLLKSELENIYKEIWKPAREFYFKKSHAYGYAMVVLLQMNLLKQAVI